MYEAEIKEEAYRSYVADVLRLAGENLHKAVLGGGAGYYDIRWSEINNPRDVEEQTGDEIAISIMKRAGLSFEEKQE